MNATNRWKLGLFVLVAFAVGLSGLAWLGLGRSEETTAIHAFFDEPVDGLEIGSSVKFRGARIGEVVDIRVAHDRRHVHVVAAISRPALERLDLFDPTEWPPRQTAGPFLDRDVRVQLVKSPLTGVAFLQTDVVDPAEHPLPTYDFEIPFPTVPAVPSTLKTLEHGVVAVLERLPTLTDELILLVESIDSMVRDMRPGALIDDLSGLVSRVDRAVGSIDALVRKADERDLTGELGALLQSLTETLDGLRGEEGVLERLVAAVESAEHTFSATLDDARVGTTTASLRRAADSAGVAFDEVVLTGEGLRAELAGLRDALRAVTRLAEMLEHDPGALVRGAAAAPRRTLPDVDGEKEQGR